MIRKKQGYEKRSYGCRKEKERMGVRKKENRGYAGQQRTGLWERILTLLFACVYMGGFLGACGREKELTFALDGETGQETIREAGREETASAEIYVHVCGAVRSPGLKRLPEGSRVWDALEMAEGFTEDADQSAVNLAAPVSDGQQLYFPTMEEVQSGEPDGGKVNLNTADEQQLRTLPGIGSSRAQAILKYREEHNGFSSVEELMQVPGIKEGVYEQLCDQVIVK